MTDMREEEFQIRRDGIEYQSPSWAVDPAERCGDHSAFGMECDLIEGHAGDHMALHTNGLVRGAWPSEPKTFSDWLGRELRETYDRLVDQHFDEATIVASPEVHAKVQKLQAYMPVSCCLMTDSTGVNHCDHPAPPRPPWVKRTRWRIRSWWSGLRMRVGSWIAGTDLDREDD